MRWPGEAAGPWQGWLAGPQRRWGLLCLQGLPPRPPTPATGRGWTDTRASSTHLCMGPRLRSQKPLPTEAPGRRPSAVTPLGQLGPATGPSPRLKPRREERAALMYTAGRTPRPSSQTGGNTRPDSTSDSVTSGGASCRHGPGGGAGRRRGAGRPCTSIRTLVPHTPVCHKPAPCTLTSLPESPGFNRARFTENGDQSGGEGTAGQRETSMSSFGAPGTRKPRVWNTPPLSTGRQPPVPAPP